MIFAPIKTIQKYIHPDLHPSWKGQSQNKTKTKGVYYKLKKPRELVTLPAPTGESSQSLRTIMNHEETWKTWLNRKRTKQTPNIKQKGIILSTTFTLKERLRSILMHALAPVENDPTLRKLESAILNSKSWAWKPEREKLERDRRLGILRRPTNDLHFIDIRQLTCSCEQDE